MKDQPSDQTKAMPPRSDLQFAVFNGNKEITPQKYKEVERFAAYVADYKKTKIVSE